MRKTLKAQNLNRLLYQIEYCRKVTIDVKFEANVKMKIFVLFYLTNSSLELTSSKCWRMSLIAYLLCLVDVCLYRQSAFLWILTMPIFLQSCSFIRERQGILKKNGRKLPILFDFTFSFLDDVFFNKYIQIMLLCRSYLDIHNQGQTNFTTNVIILIFLLWT